MTNPESNLNATLQSNDWTKLIRKLRWIGMEEEANRLQEAVRTVPPDLRDTVSAEPLSTD